MIFFTKECKYELPYVYKIDSAWVQATYHGLKSFKDYVDKIWNSLPKSFKSDISVEYLIVLIKY